MAETRYKPASQAAQPRKAVGEMQPQTQWHQQSGDAPSMSKLGGFKSGGLISLLLGLDGKQDAYPDIGQGTHCDRMAFPFCPFALIILFCPAFQARTVKSKLVQSISQRFDTAQATMSFGIHPALEEDRRGSCQGLQAGCRLVAMTIITDFGEQTRGKSCPSSGQGLEQIVILRYQKKAFDLLVVVSNLTHQRLQLVQQRQQQPRLGAGGDLIGREMGLPKQFNEILGFALRTRIVSLLEQGGQFRNCGLARLLRCWVRAQKSQRTGLFHLAEGDQPRRVIRFEAGGELVEQTGLRLDQGVLVAGQFFQFLNQLVIGLEPMQVSKVRTSRLGQQIRINGVGFRSRRGAVPIHGARVHGVDRPVMFQQIGNQQAVGRLDDAGNVFAALLACNALQITVQTAQSLWGMGDPDRSQLVPLLINSQGIMMLISPVYATKFHEVSPFLGETRFLNCCVLILCRSKRDSLMTSPVQKPHQGRTSFLNRSSRVETIAFPWLVRQSLASVSLALAPCRGGLILVYRIRKREQTR